MKFIYSSNYVKYNANSSGNSTGDCVNRAISFAFDKDYNDVRRMLLEEMHLQHRNSWKVRPVYSMVIDMLGGKPFDKTTPADMGYPMLKDFIDNYASKGTWLIETSSYPGKESNHIVCVYDSTIYDSWNSSKQYVFGFFKCDNAPVKQITDIKDHAQEIADYIDSTCTSLLEKMINKDKYSFWSSCAYARVADISLSGYKFTCKIRISISDCPYRPEADANYSFTVAFVLTPTMTLDAAKEYINKTAKVRMYDRLYSINQKETAEREAYQTAQEVDPSSTGNSAMNYTTLQEDRFIHTLPGWCLKLLQFVRIDRPNQYPDSVLVRMTKLPWDDYTGNNTIIFSGWNSAQVRDMINRYHDKHEIAGRDYNVGEEY